MTKKQKKNLIRILLASVMTVALWICLGENDSPLQFLFLIPYLIVGYDVLIRAVKGMIRFQPFDENFLMAVATIGAIVLRDFKEGVAVMLFYQIGELFQSYAVGKSRRNILDLMDIRPDSANVEREGGNVETVDPDEVEVGSIIVVRPGEKIPIDGVIVEGNTTLDTVALTGESVPRSAGVGDEVCGGCINQSGVIRVRTTKAFGESTASKILDLMENAGSRKSSSENFISKFARIYTPAVCGGALALAVLPPLFNLLILSAPADFGEWIYRAMTFLVISCPCALVISIPLTFFAGIGGAGREGILIKGSNYLETLSKVRVVAFDKTGTVTEGVFAVTDLHPVGIERDALLFYAAHAEGFSSHPISKSILEAYGAEIDRTRVSGVEEIGGCGVTAVVDGKQIAAGNGRLMDRLGISYEKCPDVGTVVYLAVDSVFAGWIRISDRIKADSEPALRQLKKAGVRETVMLTGDRAETAQDVAARLGIDTVRAELLPDGKVAEVEKLLTEKGEREKLAFVGDGINDAPVLARADVGIAMGAMGADAAIEAADVVLMDDNPLKIAKAIRLSRKCLQIVNQNIWFAIGVKLVCLALGAVGIAGMWIAIFADVGVMVLAVLNAIRALNVKKV